MKRWLAFLSFLYAIRLVERGLRLPDDAQAHIMYYVEAFMVLCGLMMGVSAVEKLPRAAEFVKTILPWRRKQQADPQPPAPVDPAPVEPAKPDDELIDITPPEPATTDPTTPQPPATDPAPVEPPKTADPEPVQPSILPEPPAPAPAKKKKKPTASRDLFISTFYPHAKQTEASTGLLAVAMLTQAGHESGWKLNPPGNMLFGIKARAKDPKSKKQLITTHEVLSGKHHKFSEIISITPTKRRGIYRYKVRDWFRKYETPAESFADYAALIQRRYPAAWAVRHDLNAYFDAIAKGGYATDPQYAAKLKKLAGQVQASIPASAKPPGEIGI
jgi:flagellar protein FlgJ